MAEDTIGACLAPLLEMLPSGYGWAYPGRGELFVWEPIGELDKRKTGWLRTRYSLCG
jgi:hypothetical protein